MKKIFAVALVVFMAVSMTACNKQVIDTTWSYERAIVRLPDGTVIDGKLQSWSDYEDGDQIQVKIDGVTYLLHSSDVVLISE